MDKTTNSSPTINLQRQPQLYLNLETAKGRGVFSHVDIPIGTVIDVSPVLILDPTENKQHIEYTNLYNYTYNWPVPESGDGTVKAGKTQALVLGLGSMFNHSSTGQNVVWQRDLERQCIVYKAFREIRAGEELCISYGDRLTFIDAEAKTDGQDEDGTKKADREDEANVLSNIELERWPS